MKRTLLIAAIAAWVAAAIVAFVYRQALMASPLGALALIALCFPVAFALYMLVEGLGEGIVFLLLVVAFKVVTLGLIQTEFTSEGLSFPWYGLTRANNGRLVASEGIVAIIGTLTYAVAGVVWYLVQNQS